MNSAIELHDSDIVELRRSGRELRVVLDPAYVHRSTGQPAIDSGSGHLQTGELVFAEAQVSELGGICVGTITDGFVAAGTVRHTNVVPLPLHLEGPVSAEFVFTSGAVLRVTSAGVIWVPTGEARYVEAYEG
jgi:hypothetical protein